LRRSGIGALEREPADIGRSPATVTLNQFPDMKLAIVFATSHRHSVHEAAGISQDFLPRRKAGRRSACGQAMRASKSELPRHCADE